LCRNLSRECLTRDARVYVIAMPARIRSFVCERHGFTTICINECLSPEARRKALEHELWHLEHDDLHSDLPTDLLEIRAHKEGG